ncbi:hypothetical protein [Amycolatopsis sp. 195334CR]|uniref:hypothetical protein n=1 Tax=Amycolatopsis sp. 195334CR TaxID=2814588 RepID=UPI001A8E39DF|nr:hypothetical protein [Amycolatopsis sp. 195334CR]MBN6036127.1 hypothetical protein [Amycolatopsis sp. 195334CR]
MSDIEPDWPPEPPSTPHRLHRPSRAIVAVVELVLAGVAVWLATLAWSASISTVRVRASDGAELTSFHYAGNWVLAAIVLGLAATLLVVDAVRQFVLGARARPRKPRKDPQPAHS